MDKQEIIRFFDGWAPHWDEDMIRNEEVIAAILDNAEVGSGSHILDVACGTGVLFPDYLGRGVASVTGIDISPEMTAVARRKYPQIEVICGDAESMVWERQFDVVMIYNAFPHFPDPTRLIETLAKALCPGGRLSIAHGMSRAALLEHHAKRANDVSLPLPDERSVAAMMAPWLEPLVMISDERMYQVVGRKKES